LTIEHWLRIGKMVNGQSSIANKKNRKMNKETWKFILQTLAAILTAIATTLGVTSCLGA